MKKECVFEITKIKTLWPEGVFFLLDRENIGNQYIFIYFHTQARVEVNGKMVVTKPGAVVIFNKFSHQRIASCFEPILHDWMHIEGELDGLMQKCGLLYGVPYYPQDGGFITDIMRELELETMQNGKFSSEIQESLFCELFYKISREVTALPSELNRKTAEILITARQEIHRTFSKNWETESMAELAHLSPSRFHFLYKKMFGISPKKDLQNVRLEHAKRLLGQKRYSVKLVAEKIGYENEYYFIRKFKEAFGVTPGKYSEMP